jgi:hypothetical protein
MTSDDSNTSGQAPQPLGVLLGVLGAARPDLALLVERWDALPQPVKAGIVAMVRAATGEGGKP